MTKVPHLNIVVAMSAFVVLAFAAVTVYVLGWTSDDVTKGNVIGTWITFATAAVFFWLGSSSGGKAKPDDTPTGKLDDPVHVTEEPML